MPPVIVPVCPSESAKQVIKFEAIVLTATPSVLTRTPAGSVAVAPIGAAFVPV